VAKYKGEVTPMSMAEVLALDIGTRKIAGLLVAAAEEGFELKEAIVEQQLPGAMADGQIHHIDAVAKVIKRIKQNAGRIPRPHFPQSGGCSCRALPAHPDGQQQDELCRQPSLKRR